MSKSEKLKFQKELEEATKKIAEKKQESGEVFKWSYVYILLNSNLFAYCTIFQLFKLT